MLLRPRRVRKSLPTGVGAPPVAELTNPVLQSHMYSVLNDVRRAGRVPFSWVRSVGWNSPKNNGKRGMLGLRTVHSFCPVAKAWMASLMRRGPCPRLPVGYESGRRRECAIAVQDCMAWRLNRAKLS